MMCPDPLDAILPFFGVIGFIIAFDFGFAFTPFIGVIAVALWTFIVMMWRYFAPGHAVVCGIPVVLPSRWEYLTHIKTDEEKRQEEAMLQRWNAALDELKEKGAIAKDATLEKIMPKLFRGRGL